MRIDVSDGRPFRVWNAIDPQTTDGHLDRSFAGYLPLCVMLSKLVERGEITFQLETLFEHRFRQFGFGDSHLFKGIYSELEGWTFVYIGHTFGFHMVDSCSVCGNIAAKMGVPVKGVFSDSVP